MSAKLRAENRKIRQELEAQEKIRSVMDGLCMRKLKTKDNGPCKNQNRKEDDEKGCAFCFGYSNFK